MGVAAESESSCMVGGLNVLYSIATFNTYWIGSEVKSFDF